MKLSPNDPCPCGLPQKFKRCCQRFHRGALAPTPEALMRSRYAAYAAGDADYLMATTDPDGPHAQPDPKAWRADLRAWCRATTFERLEVREAAEDGDQGVVTFRAQLRQGAHDLSFTERSRFRRVQGRWLYTDGDLLEEPAP